MRFLSAKPLVLAAQREGFAVPAFNTNGGTYDITRAALEAAEESASPLIVQAYEPNLEYRGVRYFVNLVKFLYDDLGLSVPVALQIDHGKSLAGVVQGIRAGLTSVMIDASHEPPEENIRQTRRVVEVAHPLGVSVEAEVGCVKGNEPRSQRQVGRIPVPERPEFAPTKTDVEEAARFVRETKVDMLAVAVGTVHGVYQRQTGIDFDLVRRLREAVPVPLVMHGTGGIGREDLARLTRMGMAKINFGEPFRYHYIEHFSRLTDEMEHLWHPWRIMREIKDRLKEDMKDLIRTLGSAGKANRVKIDEDFLGP